MFDLSGRVALVTGAGRSIGAGIAQTIAEAGAAVAVNDLDAERARESAQQITDVGGGSAIPCPFDVTDLDAVERAVADIEAELGAIDILVNNAGIVENAGTAFFRESTPDYWHRWIDLNLFGVLNCTRAVIDGMCDREFGRVVTISSGAGVTGLSIGMSAYAAGKGGAISFMRHLAMETAKFGVTANTLALGMMENTAGREMPDQVRRPNPVGRLGTGRDVGAAVVWLASEGSWVTGQTIGVNGGALTS
jgi:NAD(P)-dependent dehydrogenase (short-subunit alcohol dehydrogenase family)